MIPNTIEGHLVERPSINFGYQQPLPGAEVPSLRRRGRHENNHNQEETHDDASVLMVADSPRCWKCSNADPHKYRTLVQGVEHEGLTTMTSHAASSRRAS